MNHSTQSILVILPAKQLQLDSDPRGFGGIYKAALAHVQALRHIGIHVTVLTASLPFYTEASRLGAECYFHPHWHSSLLPLLNPRCWLQAWRVLRTRPLAALHHSGRSWPWAKILLFSTRNIGILHTGSLHRTKYFKYQFALSSITLAALQTAPANQKYQFRRIKNGLFRAHEHPIKVRSPIPAFHAQRPLLLGHLGRVCHDKGIDILLQALAMLKNRDLSVNLRVTGGSAPEYVKLADELGISDRVTFQEWIDDPEEFYGEVDFLCLASRVEPFGLVVLEAMSRGLPVIASAAHGPTEIIQHGVSGFLFPVGDYQTLAALIEQVYHEPSLCETLGQGALQRIAEEYSCEAVGHSIIEAIHSFSKAS